MGDAASVRYTLHYFANGGSKISTWHEKMLWDHAVTGSASELFKIAAVCDLDRAKTAHVADALGVPGYDDLDALLAAVDVPVIALFTGPAGRAALVRKIVRAGRHVMTTKPFDLDAKASRAALEEARSLGKVVHMNSPAPEPSDDPRQIMQWHEALDLGRPVWARADVWVRYQEQADGSWKDDPKRCPGGPLFRLGVYLFNDLIRLLGPIEAVQVFHHRMVTQRPTPDTAQAILRFRNGALGNVFASFCVNDTQSYRNALTLNYERGTIYREVRPQAGAGEENGTRLSLVTHKGDHQEAIVQSRSGDYHWDTFHKAVMGHQGISPSYIEAVVQGVEVIEAISSAGEAVGGPCVSVSPHHQQRSGVNALRSP